MSTNPELITAEDLLQLPASSSYELVRGQIIVRQPPGFEHGVIVSHLQHALSEHVASNNLGTVVASGTGFILSRHPDTVRGVDIGFVRAARVPSPKPSGFFLGAPDLAVEVISPGDTVSEVEEKTDEYLNAGTREVWIISPRRRTVTVYRPRGKPVMLDPTDTLDGGDVLPGFSCLVSAIFE